MSAILLKVFSSVMSVIITLSATFPVAFGNRIYIDPVENTTVLGSEFISQKYFEETTVVSDLETVESVFDEAETGEFSGDFFENFNLVCIPVVLPSTSYKVFVSSVAEKADTAEVKYKLVNDGCVGATMISHATICITVSKNIKNADVSATKVVVPFCIHE